MENIKKMIFNKIKELKDKGLKIGITFSQFDLLHAGHIAMLSQAKNHCDYLIAGLQNNAQWDRPEKNAPIQSIVERQISLSVVRFVDEIVVYNTEKDLEDIDTKNIITTSKRTRKPVQRYIPEDMITLYFNDVDIEKFVKTKKKDLKEVKKIESKLEEDDESYSESLTTDDEDDET